MSRLYVALAAIQRRARQSEPAFATEARRLSLSASLGCEASGQHLRPSSTQCREQAPANRFMAVISWSIALIPRRGTRIHPITPPYRSGRLISLRSVRRGGLHKPTIWYTLCIRFAYEIVVPQNRGSYSFGFVFSPAKPDSRPGTCRVLRETNQAHPRYPLPRLP